MHSKWRIQKLLDTLLQTRVAPLPHTAGKGHSQHRKSLALTFPEILSPECVSQRATNCGSWRLEGPPQPEQDSDIAGEGRRGPDRPLSPPRCCMWPIAPKGLILGVAPAQRNAQPFTPSCQRLGCSCRAPAYQASCPWGLVTASTAGPSPGQPSAPQWTPGFPLSLHLALW